MNRLALLGASGHGKVVADMALLTGWDEIAFFDDAWPERQSNGPWKVRGTSVDLMGQLGNFDGVVVSIGHCKTRLDKQRELTDAGARMMTIVHPAAVVSRHATLGAGTVVMAGAVINIGAVIGLAGIINTGSSIDHDCQIGDAVHVCPGAHLSGDVRVGACSWVGVGAAVRQGLVIGQHVLVGAGGVVVSDVSDGLTIAGNPARPLPARCD
jgi:sugar O-acyltransferase (sialic acid O-acetyltransferase NeuD family)